MLAVEHHRFYFRHPIDCISNFSSSTLDQVLMSKMVSVSVQAFFITLSLSASVLADPVLTAREPGITIEASGAYVGTAFVPKGSESIVTDGTAVWSIGTDGHANRISGAAAATATASGSVGDTASSQTPDSTGVATTSSGVAVSVGTDGVSVGRASSTTTSSSGVSGMVVRTMRLMLMCRIGFNYVGSD